MARWLTHAAAIALVVCSVSRVAGSSRWYEGFARVHVGAGSVAAGRAHTVIATPDGRVFAWGAGGRGQIGDGALVDRWAPTLVPGLEGIIAVTAGAAHTVALSQTGDVYAWGANTFGRLGDGTQKRRARPVRVSGLRDVTMVAAGRAHTLALTADGRVFAWGLNTNGGLGNGKKTSSLIPLLVPGLSDVVAIAAGDAHSLAVTRDGRLFAWGRNDFSALGDGTTKDRPTPVPIALRDVIAVAAGGAHSLALLRDGAVYSWGRGANGELGTGATKIASTPTTVPGLTASAIRAGRHFSAAVLTDGRVVTWGANGSGQLGDGTTVRRLRPVQVRGVEAVTSLALGALHAVAATTTGDVRSWGEGESGRLGANSQEDQSSAVEIISDVPDWGATPGEDPVDMVPPTILATTTPPLHDGWMTTPVIVSFTCADDVEIASCSGPMTLTQDGYGQQITGTAVDRAGNSAAATVVVNLDLRPPSLSIVEPQNEVSTPAEEVVVTATAADSASGLVETRCNGNPVAVTDGQLTCVVPLRPGRNDIVLFAADAVGHSTSTAISIARIGTPTSLVLTPATRVMEVDEEARLTLRDDFGAQVDEAVWATSHAEVISLSETDPPVLRAVAIGQATITAEKDGMIAEASIVVSPGLAPGDVRWTLTSTPEFSSEPPLFANRVDPDGPHIFTVETQEWGTALLRAVTTDGEVLWQQHSPGIPLMGDSFGGVVAGVVDEFFDTRAYARGPRQHSTVAYDSDGTLSQPAQAPDGTLYAIESRFGSINPDGQEVFDKYALVIDGATGRRISRTRLDTEVEWFISDRNGDVIPTTPPTQCRTTRFDNAPDTIGPVVGSDGRGYMIVRRLEVTKRGGCIEPFMTRPDRTIRMGIDLIALSPKAPPETIPIASWECQGAFGTTIPCDLPVQAYQLMPDGIGGTLVTWERGSHMVGNSVFVQKAMTRVEPGAETIERDVLRNFWMELVGQNGILLTYDDEWSWLDVRSGEVTSLGRLPALVPLAARPNRGLAILDWSTGDLRITNATGGIASSQGVGLPWSALNETGDWIGLRDSELASVVGEFPDATRWSALRGNAQGQQAVRRPGRGIFGKTHLAIEMTQNLARFRHVSIRVVPHDQERWLNLPDLQLPGTDQFGNRYFTLGAGSDGTDTNSSCAGTLKSDLNRPNDVGKPPWDPLDALAYPLGAEDALINALLSRDRAYPDDLPYACRPEQNPGFYNSNSYAHGLLNAAGLRGPSLPDRLPSLVPGWRTPVPLSKFQ